MSEGQKRKIQNLREIYEKMSPKEKVVVDRAVENANKLEEERKEKEKKKGN